ncbi:alpha/beta hydrolase [Peptostreptococcus faecalis]|uniref:alpha/beta hydrolase n=1 Tax=Peptostreptococcus faecalis TaxID=2045015 RepID=UPI0015E0D111|nr:alpha/beta hydrolase [Peptostreptococcus faecalis]
MKTFLIIFALLIIIVLVAVGIIANKFAHELSNPQRTYNESNPKNAIGMDYENVEFTSKGNKIKGWYIPAENARFNFVFAHGYTENKECKEFEMYDLVKKINSMGGNFLSFDFSGEGESEGNIVTCGYREKDDLREAISFIKQKSDKPVFSYGISMGAVASILQAEGQNNVRGVIADSPFSSMRDYLNENLGVWTPLPSFFHPILIKTLEKISNISVDEVEPVKSIKNVNVPVLLIHAKGDEMIPYAESQKIYNANKEKVIFKLMDNYGHRLSFSKNKDEYTDLLQSFIEANLIK